MSVKTPTIIIFTENDQFSTIYRSKDNPVHDLNENISYELPCSFLKIIFMSSRRYSYTQQQQKKRKLLLLIASDCAGDKSEKFLANRKIFRLRDLFSGKYT